MKFAIFASLLTSASAFAPASTASTRSTALNGGKESFGNEIGVVAPLGYWDPMNLLGDADSERFDELRWLELKHGRVAMLAVVGYLVTYAGIRFPGADDIPAGFAALDAIPDMVKGQMGVTFIFMEIANRDQTGGNNEFPGDFRNNKLDFGWDKQTDEWKMKKRTIELNNGRAAQMGIAGLMFHEALGNINEILPTP